MIEYEGYLGVFEFDPEIDAFHGTVRNINDVITFYGTSVTELREEMRKSIETYLEFCHEQGKIPEKPFYGTFQIQTSQEVNEHIDAYTTDMLSIEPGDSEVAAWPIASVQDWESTSTRKGGLDILC